MTATRVRDDGPFAIETPEMFDGEGFVGARAVIIDAGRIAAIAAAAPEGIAVRRLPEGAILAPGFIDLQVNGGGGALLNDDPTRETIARIARAHRASGTTGLLPTLISDRRAVLEQLAGSAVEALAIPGVLGFHLEGPFINLARMGIHQAEHVRVPTEADLRLVESFARCGASMVTLAPEIAGVDAVRRLSHSGLRVAIGHSDANARSMAAALEAGATGVTHLFNAMSQIGPREPGVVGVSLADSRLFAGIIGDFIHVNPVNILLAFRLKGRDRLMLVSDAMPTVGASITRFSLHGEAIWLTEGRLTNASGTLAGAHLSMIEAIRHTSAITGIGLDDALAMASLTPATFLGLEHELGRIAPGYRADLVAFDTRFGIIDTWIAGQDSGESA